MKQFSYLDSTIIGNNTSKTNSIKNSSQVSSPNSMIEMIIISSMLAILAFISVSQYKIHTAKSQVLEAINILGSAKYAVNEHVAENGEYPNSNASLAKIYPMINSLTTSTKYISSLTSRINKNNYVIKTTFKSNGVHKILANKSVSFVQYFNNTNKWNCYSENIPQEFLPAGCN